MLQNIHGIERDYELNSRKEISQFKTYLCIDIYYFEYIVLLHYIPKFPKWPIFTYAWHHMHLSTFNMF